MGRSKSVPHGPINGIELGQGVLRGSLPMLHTGAQPFSLRNVLVAVIYVVGTAVASFDTEYAMRFALD